jgi:acyl carrier protein
MSESQLLMILADISNKEISDISPDDTLDDLGMDSMSLVLLREVIERTFMLYIKDDVWTDLISNGNMHQEYNWFYKFS